MKLLSNALLSAMTSSRASSSAAASAYSRTSLRFDRRPKPGGPLLPVGTDPVRVFLAGEPENLLVRVVRGAPVIGIHSHLGGLMELDRSDGRDEGVAVKNSCPVVNNDDVDRREPEGCSATDKQRRKH